MTREDIKNVLGSYKSMLNKKENTLEGYAEEIKAAEETRVKALEKAGAAMKAEDKKKTHDALEEKRLAEDTIELYKTKSEKLRATVLIPDKEEYVTRRDELMSQLDAEEEETVEKVAKLLDQLDAVTDEFIEKVEIGNEALCILQKDLYCDPRLVKLSTGEVVGTIAEKKHEFYWVKNRIKGIRELLNIKGE